MVNLLTRTVVLYEAGRVKRLHAKSTVAEHTVAAHVYGSLVIAVELAALNSVRLDRVMLTLLYHDAAEVATGDIPAPVKRENPELAQWLRELEQAWESRVGLTPPGDLTELECALVKACDTLDLAFNVLYEKMMGNSSPWVHLVFTNCLRYLEEQSHVQGVADFKSHLSRVMKELEND